MLADVSILRLTPLCVPIIIILRTQLDTPSSFTIRHILAVVVCEQMSNAIAPPTGVILRNHTTHPEIDFSSCKVWSPYAIGHISTVVSVVAGEITGEIGGRIDAVEVIKLLHVDFNKTF